MTDIRKKEENFWQSDIYTSQRQINIYWNNFEFRFSFDQTKQIGCLCCFCVFFFGFILLAFSSIPVASNIVLPFGGSHFSDPLTSVGDLVSQSHMGVCTVERPVMHWVCNYIAINCVTSYLKISPVFENWRKEQSLNDKQEHGRSTKASYAVNIFARNAVGTRAVNKPRCSHSRFPSKDRPRNVRIQITIWCQ